MYPLESGGYSTKRILEKLKLPVIIEPNDGIIISIKIGIDSVRSGPHNSHYFSNMDLSDENFIIATFVMPQEIEFNQELCLKIILIRN